MLWIRPLSLVFGTTIFAVGIIIASFILGLGIGSWIAGKYSGRIKKPLKIFGLIQLGIGLYGITLVQILPQLQYIYLSLYQASPSQEIFFVMQLLLSMIMVVPPAMLMGATLPIMVKEYTKVILKVGNDIGKLDGINSIGAFVGVIAVTFFMIPHLGIQTSLFITGIINIGLGSTILIGKKLLPKKAVIPIIIGFIIIIMSSPLYNSQLLNMGLYIFIADDWDSETLNKKMSDEMILFYKESPYQTVIVNTNDDGEKHLKLDGKPQCGNITLERDGLRRLAIIPIELYDYNYGGHDDVKALNIGLGCGTVSDTLSIFVDTTTIEIDPVVPEATQIYFYPKIEHTLIIDDARNHLLRNEQKYQIIVTEPSPIWQQDSHLYTKEFYELVKSRLTSDGIMAQWLPSYSLDNYHITVFMNTFESVFPYVYAYQMQYKYDGMLILVGSETPLETNPDRPLLFEVHRQNLIETELNTDDNPVLEWNSIKMMYKRDTVRNYDFITS